MRSTSRLFVVSALGLFVVACAPKPAPQPAPPPPPPVECAPGRVAKGEKCVAIDADCRPDETLEFGVGCVRSGGPPEPKPPPPEPSAFPPGVDVRDVTIGTGPVARSGANLVVHYTGTLVDGTRFDSSVDRKQPFQFRFGAGHVIKGWEAGLVGMRVGGRRILTIEHAMAYGERGHPPLIPPRSTLVFTIDLLEVK